MNESDLFLQQRQSDLANFYFKVLIINDLLYDAMINLKAGLRLIFCKREVLQFIF